MMLAFKEGKDLHTATAEALGCETPDRKKCKLWFAVWLGGKGT